MDKKHFFKKTVALLIAMTLVLSCVNPMQLAYADVNEYSNVINTVDGHNAHGTIDGYTDSCIYHDEAMNLICTVEPHLHDASCYIQSICDLAEHTHTEDCYSQKICDEVPHIHTDECYTLVCTKVENHIHSSACTGQLICTNPHIHSEDCLKYDCGMTEEHIHTFPQCYAVGRDELICKKTEHTHELCNIIYPCEAGYDEDGHNESCYKVCDLEENHVHDSSCFTLICTIPENNHVHSDDCMGKELICTQTEHTHSTEAGGCQETVLTCTKTNHVHDTSCYTINQAYYTCSRKINTYNINYILGAEGAVNGSNNPTTYTVNDSVVYKDALRDGFEFDGWYNSGDFNAEDRVTGITAGTTGDITVYAKWSEKIYPDDDIQDGTDDDYNDDYDDDVNIDIADEEIPGGSIPEENPAVTTDGTVKEEAKKEIEEIEEVKSDNAEEVDLTEGEIPGAAAKLPDTGGVTADLLYGLGSLAVVTGAVFKRRNK